MNNDDIDPPLDRYLQNWFRDESIFMWLLLIILIFYKNKYKLGGLYERLKQNHDTGTERFSLGIIFGLLNI